MENSKQLCVLVTGVGGDIGACIIRCLKDSGYRLKLVGCDTNFYAAGKGEIDSFSKVPKVVNEEDYLSFIKDIVEEHNVKYILPTTEPEITLFNRKREYFRKDRVTLLINNPFIIDTFSDKYETINFLKKHKLPHPATFLLEEYDGQLGFPLVIKPRRGYGSWGYMKYTGVMIIKNKREFDFHKENLTDVVVQEYIGNEDEEYTVGIFSDGANIYSICFHRYLGFGSMSIFAQLVHDNKIKHLTEAIAKASQLEGPINIQLRKTERGYVPFEINPRLSSTVYFRHYFGFQDAKWWLDLKEGRPIEYKPKYKEGVGVRTVGEVFFEMIQN